MRFNISANNGPLQAFIAMISYIPDADFYNFNNNFYIYDSPYLNNFIGIYNYSPTSSVTNGDDDSSFAAFNATNGTLTIFYVGQHFARDGYAQIIARNPEEHSKNCINRNNILYVYANRSSIVDMPYSNQTYSANNSGPCIYSIITPIANLHIDLTDSDHNDKLPSLNLNALGYNGDDSVSVVRGYNSFDDLNTFDISNVIFEFNETDAFLWNNINIFGI